MSNSVRPHRWQPTRLLCPWDSPGKNTGVGCHFLLQCMHAKSLQSCPTLCDPWTAAHQAPLSMGFSRQEYWSGLSFPSPGDRPNPGIKPRSPELQADSLVAQTVKHLPTIRETRVRSLSQEDPLEKEMATHTSTLVWRIPWMEEPTVPEMKYLCRP